MTVEAPAAVQCGICSTPRKGVINAFLAAGRNPHFIEREMRTLGSPTKAETVRRHLARCLNGSLANASISDSGVTGDFAQAVQREAARLLAAGELKIKAEHGLAAQGLLDRRAEHSANRTLMLNIARLLSGGADTTPAEVIVGEWREVAPPQLIVQE